MQRLGDIFDIRTGYTFRDSISAHEPGDVAVVQSGDINAARLAQVRRIGFNGAQHLLQAGDLLLSARGNATAHTVTPDILPAVAASSVVVLRPILQDLNSRFITRFLNSPAGQAALSKIMSGAYIKTLRKVELEELKVPMPPAAIQQKLVELGDTIDSYRQTLQIKEQLLIQIYDQAIKLGAETL
jgi:restriction endonuclease S subunit